MGGLQKVSASDGIESGLKWVVTASEGVMSDSENIVRVSKGVVQA